MSKIEIKKIDASKMRILIDDEGIIEDIYTFFKYKQPNFQKSRFSKWDGTVRLFDKKNQTLPCGLLQILLMLFKDRGYEYDLDPVFKEEITQADAKEVSDWIDELKLTNELGERLDAYDYQREAAYLSIRYGRLVLLAATSAGKSAIQYIMTRYYEMMPENGKTLIIVPSIMLVNQMKQDFKDYSLENGWDAERNVHTIAEGAVRHSTKPIYISTWQSLQDMPDDYFHQFGNLIVDECHLASGETISKISKMCINANRRIGLTGTLKADELHPLQVQAHFGPIRRIVTTKQLQDAGRAAQTKVTFLDLYYPPEQRKDLAMKKDGERYDNEMEFLMAHPYRNKVLKSLALSLKGNTLMLFARIEKHLEVVVNELIAEGHTNKEFFVINGSVKSEDRERIKKATERGNDIVIFASFQTMSTGVSIKKLHNLVFAFPTKSIVRVLQSIGRMLRLHESKEFAHIIDICDDLAFMGAPNSSKEHALIRFGYYRDEGHKVTIKKIIVPGVSDTHVLV